MPDFVAEVALGESLAPVGQLRFSQAGPRQFSTFAYTPAWLENPRAFAVQPDFPLEGGPFHTSAQPGNTRDALASAFADAAPDSWGRRLLERAYGNGLTEFDYLTLSDDACRQGALRFLDAEGRVIRGTAADAVPRLIDLKTITAIARAYEQGKERSPPRICGRWLAPAAQAGPVPKRTSGTAIRSGWPSSPRSTISNPSSVSRSPRSPWLRPAAFVSPGPDWNWLKRRFRWR